MQGAVRTELRFREIDRLVRTFERALPIVGDDVAVRLIALVERLIDAMAGGKADDATNLLQA